MVAALAMATATAAPAEIFSRKQVAAELSVMPLYQTLAKHYPTTHSKIVGEIADGLNNGRRRSDVVAELHSLVIALLAKEAPKANIENTVNLLSITRDQTKATLAKDPAACMALLGLAPDDGALAKALPQDLVDQEMVVTAKLLEQTALAPEQPVDPLDPQTVDALAFEAYDRLPDDRLRAAFMRIGGDASKATDPISQTAYCEFSLAMFDIMLSMPPIEAARTFKGFNALEAAENQPTP